MVVVLLAPVVLVFAVALVAIVFVSRSSLRITSAGVEIHNYPRAPRLIPIAHVAHFAATPRVGNFSSLRPPTAVLVLTDGSRVPVRSITAPDAGKGVDALNQRVESLRND